MVGSTTIQHIACTGSWSRQPVTWVWRKWEIVCQERDSNSHLWHSDPMCYHSTTLAPWFHQNIQTLLNTCLFASEVSADSYSCLFVSCPGFGLLLFSVLWLHISTQRLLFFQDSRKPGTFAEYLQFSLNLRAYSYEYCFATLSLTLSGGEEEQYCLSGVARRNGCIVDRRIRTYELEIWSRETDDLKP